MKAKIVFKGGKGSGNFGHAGRPGKVGGSAAGSGGKGGGTELSIADIDERAEAALEGSAAEALQDVASVVQQIKNDNEISDFTRPGILAAYRSGLKAGTGRNNFNERNATAAVDKYFRDIGADRPEQQHRLAMVMAFSGLQNHMEAINKNVSGFNSPGARSRFQDEITSLTNGSKLR